MTRALVLALALAGCSRLTVQPPASPTMPGGCTLLRVAPITDAVVAAFALVTTISLVAYGVREDREYMIGLAVPTFALGFGFAWSSGGGFRDTARCRRAYVGKGLPAGRYY